MSDGIVKSHDRCLMELRQAVQNLREAFLQHLRAEESGWTHGKIGCLLRRGLAYLQGCGAERAAKL